MIRCITRFRALSLVVIVPLVVTRCHSTTGLSFYKRSLPRYDEHFIDIRTWSKISSHELLPDIGIFLNFLKQSPLKYYSNVCRKLL